MLEQLEYLVISVITDFIILMNRWDKIIPFDEFLHSFWEKSKSCGMCVEFWILFNYYVWIFINLHLVHGPSLLRVKFYSYCVNNFIKFSVKFLLNFINHKEFKFLIHKGQNPQKSSFPKFSCLYSFYHRFPHDKLANKPWHN
jgi:hypothetical protein